jgi:antitoxin HicB
MRVGMYAAEFIEDEGTLLVTFPDVPEAITFAVDAADATRRAREALTIALSMYVDKGKPLPAASRVNRGQVDISLPAGVTAKLALYNAMREAGVSKAELGRRLGYHRQHIDRIVDLCHKTRFEVLEAALEVVGKRAYVMVENLAQHSRSSV